jgi:TRAP-type C4-dicarboxylate transport system substrate-binding protein
MSAKLVEGFGAAPVFMGGNEVYMALQRKTVDGAISGLSSFADRKYYEVQKYLTINNAGLVQFVVSMNQNFFNSLSPEQQQIVLDAAKEATEYSRKNVLEEDKKALDTLKAHMDVYEVTDFAPWKEAAKATRDLYVEKAGETGKKLLEIAETIQ